jgi:hypothetical protein
LSSTSNWNTPTNWSPTGLPTNGDTVDIPQSISLTLSNDLTLQNSYFDVYGSLVLSGNNMKLILQNTSTVNVHTSGTINGNRASQQIVLGSIIYKGNSPVLVGPMIATSTTSSFVPYIEFSVLPVKFLSFTVTPNHANAVVQWTTTEEVGAAYYEVQRSKDGKVWITVATVRAVGNATNNYMCADKNWGGAAVQYRIRQVDIDGTATFTSIRTLNSRDADQPIVTAFQNTIRVQFQQAVKERAVIEVVGLNGYVVLQKVVGQGFADLQLPVRLKGIYIVRISNGNDLNIAKQVLL